MPVINIPRRKKENLKILIIGNGFDLWHGLETRYRDFLKHLKRESSDNIWFRYFNSITFNDKWVDLEAEIAEIFNFLESNKNFFIKNKKLNKEFWEKDVSLSLLAFEDLWGDYFFCNGFYFEKRSTDSF